MNNPEKLATYDRQDDEKQSKNTTQYVHQGADPEGGRGGGWHPASAPPKIGKNKIFLRNIVIFHTKYLKYFRASLRSARLF